MQLVVCVTGSLHADFGTHGKGDVMLQRSIAGAFEDGASPCNGPASFLNMDLDNSDSDDSSFG